MLKARLLAWFAPFLMVTSLAASDWKICGYIPAQNNLQLLFYDASSVTVSGKVVRVWTKSITRKTLNVLGSKHKELIDAAARRMNSGYVPELLTLEAMKAQVKDNNDYRNGLGSEIFDEMISNLPESYAHTSIFWEIDYNTKRYAMLTVTTQDKAGKIKTGARDIPKYEYLEPDTVMDHLTKLIQKYVK